MATAVEGGLYRHFKGGMYRVLHLAEHADDRHEVVVYENTVTGTVWVRDKTEFESPHESGVERFVKAGP